MEVLQEEQDGLWPGSVIQVGAHAFMGRIFLACFPIRPLLQPKGPSFTAPTNHKGDEEHRSDPRIEALG